VSGPFPVGVAPRLGVVVVGTGFGCFTHVRALQRAGFEVVALVGRDRARTDERARMFGVPRAAGSLSEALETRGVHAVTVATPPHTHAPLVLEAIEAGKHVLCEKPFARDRHQAEELLTAATRAGVVHLLGTEFRFDPGQALLASAVQNGLLGNPRLALWLMHVPMLLDPAADVPAWWADASAGGGWLGAHGSQLIDQMRVTLGDFAGVSASLVHVVDRPMTADDGFVVHFRMENGCVGALQSTAADGGVVVETRVTGSTATAWIEGVGSVVKVADGTGVRTLPVPADLAPIAAPPLPPGAASTTYERMITFGVEYGPYVRLATVFREMILGNQPGGPSPATFADGVAQMAVLDAIRESAAAGGAWKDVPGGGATGSGSR
jgi:predicted dehydrogenase